MCILVKMKIGQTCRLISKMWSTMSISISVKNWSIARSIDHKNWSIAPSIDHKNWSIARLSLVHSIRKKIEALIILNPQLHPVFHQSWYKNRVVVLSDGHPSKHLYTVLFSLELIFWKKLWWYKHNILLFVLNFRTGSISGFQIAVQIDTDKENLLTS